MGGCIVSMKRNDFCRLFMLLIIAAITCVACNRYKVSRQPVDKKCLLELIEQLAEAESKHTPDASLDLLKDYAERFEFVIVDSLFRPADSNMVQVRVVHDKEFPHIDVQLPLHLESQLTYVDFDHFFGPGIETPRPKEPIGFSVLYKAAKGEGDDIRVAVHSHQLPDASHPEIYQILIL